MIELTISSSDDGKLVHKWLRLLLPGLPLSGVYKSIRTGRVKVNGKRAKQDTRLQEGDVVHLYFNEEDFASLREHPVAKYQGVSRAIDVLYEDDEIVAVNKPAGILTHPADGEYKTSLAAQVEAYVYDQGGSEGAFRAAPVHRLDRNTSGVVIFAKTARAAKAWTEAFQRGEVEKEYLAIVEGAWSGAGRVAVEVRREGNVTRVVQDSGKPSETAYEVIASSRGTSLVRLRLLTGRTHQIRVHMAHLGHPLLADRKYGARPIREESFYLHAHRVRWHDVDVKAPLPGRLKDKLRSLGYKLDDLV
ncbi:RluA family pseudouridine synthase [Alicyclobacillus mali]|uniref:Pseudouridine synthase n=1 Tax=Alicyclobacillus mali (ex Roth et al. 2021) TaxID=1123961 RepID=A0ABS0EYF8_9BACL|nr:RluA family pseudouridine synthase [Alicyclobacillus mali (ex Roth et al. 2021)]MBF8376328.1 RluA family pseudouridine synthase [Alicyclobacillus mali (ex Roth et al. 2021)]MCL6488828.1 RluA family pseudouridine synthase [Alicyclobacillus mali (ex Roth et al. 2021)]